MSAKLSVEEVLSQLEARAAVLRADEAFHAEQAALHKQQRESCAAELEKVQAALESFRAAAADAVGFAQAAGVKPAKDTPEKLPPPGRLMVSRLLRLAIESPELPEPFGATAVAAEANRRFANRLRQRVGPRTASDVLRRMLGEGKLQLVLEGKAKQEALYRRKG